MKKFLKRLLAGIGIGVGAAIPGVSGGTIAVILNVYEEIISSISNFFKKFKESIIILIPILIGVIGAVIPCIILFDKLFEGMLFIMICIFAGLMIGSMPKITNEVRGKPITKKAFATGIICLLVALAIGICSVFLADKINLINQFRDPSWWFYIIMIPVGIIASFALVVPGVSGSMLLLILGFYKPLIEITSELLKGKSTNPGSVIGILCCFAIGILVGFFFTSKLMSYLLNKHHHVTMWGIIGFIVGSIIVLFFNSTIYEYYQKMAQGTTAWMSWWVEVIIGIICLIGFTILSYFLLKYIQNKQKQQQIANKND